MTRREGLLPGHQQDSVVAALYRRADDAAWTTLTPQERSRLYAQWVETPDIGQVLTSYMTPEQARSWIKDGPMKEYANARRGIGRYARFGREGGTGPVDVATAALGQSATVVPDSQGVKPPRCLAVDSTGVQVHLVWGEAGNFRNLLWAALRAATTEGLPSHVVVLEPPGRPTPTAEVATHRAMTDRCGLQLHYMPEVLGRTQVPDAPRDGDDHGR